ncbi:unnamed protein product [Caenorhabditis auriculariae]|uniref:PDZ domain-containing protein n=1 Tax=Caenorhabditis auriculariae TaxID=2777116 RepID=A0A8S1H2U9_9PELO|nr:unnamed protein product [Caenorhabditis auriculariae]
MEGHAIMHEANPLSTTEVPMEREKHIKERRTGYEYRVVTILLKASLKFGLGVKTVNRTVFVNKVDPETMVSEVLEFGDKIIDVEGTCVIDNNECRRLFDQKNIKANKKVSVLVERAVTEDTKRTVANDMDEENEKTVSMAADVKDILRRGQTHLNEKAKVGILSTDAHREIPRDRVVKVDEERHQSMMIGMDNEHLANNLRKVKKDDKDAK